jgi:hypothetical protein
LKTSFRIDGSPAEIRIQHRQNDVTPMPALSVILEFTITPSGIMYVVRALRFTIVILLFPGYSE